MHCRFALVSLTFLALLTSCGLSDDDAPGAPTITSFTANPATITAAGQAVTLSWAVSGTTDALSIRADSGASPGAVSGTETTVTPTATTTYTLTASNGSESDSSSTTVTLGGDGIPAGAPKAEFTFAQEEGTLKVNFSAAASVDPEGGALTYAWDFGDGTRAASRDYGKTYKSAGDMQVTLTVTDPDGQTGAVTKTVTVQAGEGGGTNRPPTVAIGGDNVRVSRLALNYLTAAVSDPDGDTLTYLWEITSENEDNTAVIAEPSAKDTSVRFSDSGEYTLKLTVDDGKGGVTSDTVDFVVTLSGLAFNASIDGPASVGATVAQPLNLSATIENPENLSLAYQWSMVGGDPINVVFGAPNSPATPVTFVAPGRYTLQFTVTDLNSLGDVISETVVIDVDQ